MNILNEHVMWRIATFPSLGGSWTYILDISQLIWKFTAYNKTKLLLFKMIVLI